jgi:mannose-6-phosphate isomerase-like protein (cupin superfamily)
MKHSPAFVVTKKAIKSDPALAKGARGLRKLIVTQLRENTECRADNIIWNPPKFGNKCEVQFIPNTEISFFNQWASQDRHYHKKGTEIYSVVEGEMLIEVEEVNHQLHEGDMIIINPGRIHEVIKLPGRSEFLCQVIAVNFGGASDKFIQK